MKIRELMVVLGLNADLKEAEAYGQRLDNVKQKANSLVRTMGWLSVSLAGAAASILGLAKQTKTAAVAAADTAARFGLTAEAAQEFAHAADAAGASISDVGRGMRRMARFAEGAARGSSANIEMFQRLGVEIRDSNGQLRSAESLFMDVAERIAQTKNETEQLAIAQEAFGQSGQALLPLLRRGRKGIQDSRNEARRFGMVMSNEAVASLNELNDNLTLSKGVVAGWRNIFVVELLPKLNEVVERFLAWAAASREVIQSNLEGFARKVGRAMDWAIVIAKALDSIAQSLGGWAFILKTVAAIVAGAVFVKIAAQVGLFFLAVAKVVSMTLLMVKIFATLWPIIGIVIKAVMALSKVLGVALIPSLKTVALLLIKPIAIALAVTAAIIAIGLAIQDLLVFLQGGDSLIGRFLEKFGLAGDAKEMIASLGNLLKELGKAIVSLVRISLRLWITQWKLMWPIIKPILFAIGALVAATFWVMIKSTQLLTEAWLWAFGKINEGLTWIEENWEHFGDAIKMMASDAVDFWKGVWQGFVDWFLAIIHKLIGKFDEFKEGFLKIPGAQTALSMGSEVFNRVQNAFAPSPGRNPSPRGISNSLSQSNSVNVTVNAETGASPEQIASAASQKIEEANARQLRLARAALAGGEL